MHHDHWTDRLSSYLDDDLPRGERLEVERHLLDCDVCRRTLEELRAVVAAAGSLEAQPPVNDLWPAVARRIAPGQSLRHLHIPFVWAVAAGVLLSISSAMTAYLVLHRPGEAVVDSASIEPPATLRSASIGTIPYGHAVDDLMSTLEARRDQLNPKTVQVLERSLVTIDRAIADAVSVLREHPDDLALVQRVAEQRQMKLAMLRQVERLTVAPAN
jgi:anti-sigma factor RsiW